MMLIESIRCIGIFRICMDPNDLIVFMESKIFLKNPTDLSTILKSFYELQTIAMESYGFQWNLMGVIAIQMICIESYICFLILMICFYYYDLNAIRNILLESYLF